MFIVTTLRERFEAAGRTVSGVRPASAAGRVVWGLLLLVAVIVGLVFLIPLLLLAGVAVAAFSLYAWGRRLLWGLKRDNGLLDGRRNVRVIKPGEPGPGTSEADSSGAGRPGTEG